MKKNCILACVLMSIFALAFAAASIVLFIFGQYAPGGAAIAMFLISLWVFAGYVYRENVRERFIGRYRVRDYPGAKSILDRASRNHLLYPFMRIALNQMYLRIELCLDDIPAAVHYAESLRRLGGTGGNIRPPIGLRCSTSIGRMLRRRTANTRPSARPVRRRRSTAASSTSSPPSLRTSTATAARSLRA